MLHARACTVEEDLVEVAGAGHLADGADLDPARLVHGDEQEAQTVVAAGAGLGAGQHEAPLRLVCERRPDLLTRDPVVRPLRLAHGRGAHAGQVRARARLAVALAPEFVAGGDRGQKAGLLLFGAVGEEGGGEEVLPDVAGARGRGRTGVLLGPGDLLGERGGPVAVPAFAPAEPDPAGFTEGALPGAAVLSVVGMCGQPRPRF